MRFAAMCVGLLPIACVSVQPMPRAIDPVTARIGVADLALAVQSAALQCTENARHLDQFSESRAGALYDDCVAALIPARDAVTFAMPGIGRPVDSAAVGCAGLAVRLGLARTREAFVRSGYESTPGIDMGIAVAESIGSHAGSNCDPERPTTTTTTSVDPNIARVEPSYPTAGR